MNYTSLRQDTNKTFLRMESLMGWIGTRTYPSTCTIAYIEHSLTVIGVHPLPPPNKNIECNQL